MTAELIAINELLEGAERFVSLGVEFARADDPHRFATLPGAFDGGKARRRLVLDYLADGHVLVSLQLHGTQGGEERSAQVCSFVARPTQEAH